MLWGSMMMIVFCLLRTAKTVTFQEPCKELKVVSSSRYEALDVFSSIVRRRSDTRVIIEDTNGDDTERCSINVDIENQLQPSEWFHIKNNSIKGGNGRGLFYGLGAFLKRCDFHRSDFISLPIHINITATTRNETMRAIYFATHFNNWYQVAPLDRIVEYMEELAMLWYTNTIVVTVPVFQYNSSQDPNLTTMISRVAAILNAAHVLHLDRALVFPPNQGYKNRSSSIAFKPFPDPNHVRVRYVGA